MGKATDNLSVLAKLNGKKNVRECSWNGENKGKANAEKWNKKSMLLLSQSGSDDIAMQ